MNTKVTETYEQRRRGWAVQTLRGFHFTDEEIRERLRIDPHTEIGDWIVNADNKLSMAVVNDLRDCIKHAKR